jgi:hypothetical protein
MHWRTRKGVSEPSEGPRGRLQRRFESPKVTQDGIVPAFGRRYRLPYCVAKHEGDIPSANTPGGPMSFRAAARLN